MSEVIIISDSESNNSFSEEEEQKCFKEWEEAAVVVPRKGVQQSEDSEFEEMLMVSRAILRSEFPRIQSPILCETDSDSDLPDIDFYDNSRKPEFVKEFKEPPELDDYSSGVESEGSSYREKGLFDIIKPVSESDIKRETHQTLKTKSFDDDDVSILEELQSICSSKSSILSENLKSRRKKKPLCKSISSCPSAIFSNSGRTIRTEDCLPFTPFMVSQIEACNEEKFLSSSVSLIRDFTTNNVFPPGDLVTFLLESILLQSSCSVQMASWVLATLHHIQTLHPLHSNNFSIQWDLISEIMAVLLGKMPRRISLDLSESELYDWSLLDEKPVTAALLALQFVVRVLEEDLEYEASDSRMTNSFAYELLGPKFRRKRVVDIADWVFLHLGKFYASWDIRTETSNLLRKLIHLMSVSGSFDADCVERIARSFLNPFGELSLDRRRELTQILPAPVTAQLLEFHLNSHYQPISCPKCNSSSLPSQAENTLSVDKIVSYYFKMRTSKPKCENLRESFYEDQETGERVPLSEERGIFSLLQDPSWLSPVVTKCMCQTRRGLIMHECEEYLHVLLVLTQSYLHMCFYGSSPLISQKFLSSSLSASDHKVLSILKDHVDELRSDLSRECSLSPKAKLYLSQMSALSPKLGSS